MFSFIVIKKTANKQKNQRGGAASSFCSDQIWTGGTDSDYTMTKLGKLLIFGPVSWEKGADNTCNIRAYVDKTYTG